MEFIINILTAYLREQKPEGQLNKGMITFKQFLSSQSFPKISMLRDFIKDVTYRSNPPEVFLRKGFLSKFTGEQP